MAGERRTLTKPWNKTPAGTEITTDPAIREDGVILVDQARFAFLEAEGFFAELFAEPLANDHHRPAGGVAPEPIPGTAKRSR